MNEAQQKEWLARHSREVLERVGIDRGCTVLDFGCGSGVYSIPAARLVGDGGKVYSLDKDAAELGKVKRTARAQGLQNIETILSSEFETGLEDGCVDVVLLHDVLHMIDERKALLETVSRVLCPEGRVSIYPMHVDRGELLEQMRSSGFRLQIEEFESSILVFEREEPWRIDGIL
jgi:ubiquinone/menaquinone biosynthesis C-methylase UbiE